METDQQNRPAEEQQLKQKRVAKEE